MESIHAKFPRVELVLYALLRSPRSSLLVDLKTPPKKTHALRCPSKSKAPWEISKKKLKVLEVLEVIMQTITMYMEKGVEQASLPSMFSKI